ncbi:MAG: TVP38/TMEM64 family inner membrane protein YdjZ [Firmicutes bacterium]|nr:TVP38/TMEM64 family inner membrane protein YdjZ [candidate division NPL-UPA2 bacterium]
MQKNSAKASPIRLMLALAAIVVVVLLAGRFGLIDRLRDIEGLRLWFQELGAIGYLVYVFLYILVAVFMLPASAVTIVAGITFGSVVGGVLALISATIGACVAFLLARYAARDMIVAKFGNNPLFKRIENGVRENGTSFLILTRLVPVFPYNIQNYAYGLTSISLPTFALVSLITMAPGAFIYAYMAGEIVTQGVSAGLLVQFAAAGLILFGVSLIPKYIAKKQGISIK